MITNTILTTYEDKSRQMLAIKKSTSNSVEIIHRTLFPTQSNKFIIIELTEDQLDNIINNTLAKPYIINIGSNNLIVTDTNIQFIISTDNNYMSIDIQRTSNIIKFFETVYNKLIENRSISNYICNHKDVDGSPYVETNGDLITCKECGESFLLLTKEDLPTVNVSVDSINDAINTIKLIDHTLTKSDLVMYGQLLSDLNSIPTLLEEALNKIDTL